VTRVTCGDSATRPGVRILDDGPTFLLSTPRERPDRR
jgi:hypothetical protein